MCVRVRAFAYAYVVSEHACVIKGVCVLWWSEYVCVGVVCVFDVLFDKSLSREI